LTKSTGKVIASQAVPEADYLNPLGHDLIHFFSCNNNPFIQDSQYSVHTTHSSVIAYPLYIGIPLE
jgi:hypothetical protein